MRSGSEISEPYGVPKYDEHVVQKVRAGARKGDDFLARVRHAMEVDGRARLLDLSDRVQAARVDYRAAWLRELRDGRDGQRLDQPATWRLDGLWRAAVRQSRIEEAEQLFTTMVNVGVSIELLAILLTEIEREWQGAHAVFLEQANDAAA